MKYLTNNIIIFCYACKFAVILCCCFVNAFHVKGQDCELSFKVKSLQSGDGSIVCGYLFEDNCNLYLEGSRINKDQPVPDICFSVTNIECLGHVIGQDQCDLKLDISINELKAKKITFFGKNIGYGGIKFGVGFEIPGDESAKLFYDTYALTSAGNDDISIVPYPLSDERYEGVDFVYLKKIFTSSTLPDSKFLLEEIIIEYCYDCSSKKIPDLVIENTYIGKSTLSAGSNVDISVDISNTGDEATGICEMKYYLSNDTKFSEDDFKLGYDYINSIYTGDIDTKNKRLTLPGHISGGTWFILIVLDTKGEVEESNEENNVASIQLGISGSERQKELIIAKKEEKIVKENPVPKPPHVVEKKPVDVEKPVKIDKPPVIQPVPETNLPDIIVNNVNLSSKEIEKGGIVYISCDILNQGVLKARQSSVEYYLSKDEILDESDEKMTESFIDELHVNQKSRQEERIIIPEEIEKGEWHILVMADENEFIDEIDESNNMQDIVFTIVIPLPDLIVQKQQIIIHHGSDKFSINCEIENIGTEHASESQIGYYLSKDGIIGDNDLKLGEKAITNFPIGFKDEIHFSASLPNIPEGLWHIITFVDNLNEIVELDDKNNCNSKAVTVTQADILLENVKVNNDTIMMGKTARVSCSISNNGMLLANDHTLSYYLSKDSVYSKEDDIFLMEFSLSLSRYDAKDKYMNISIPADVSPGEWYLLLLSDKENKIIESDESNNSGFVKIFITK